MKDWHRGDIHHSAFIQKLENVSPPVFLERVTFSDGFSMFSPDGKKLIWISHRNGKEPHETNVFIADWVE